MLQKKAESLFGEENGASGRALLDLSSQNKKFIEDIEKLSEILREWAFPNGNHHITAMLHLLKLVAENAHRNPTYSNNGVYLKIIQITRFHGEWLKSNVKKDDLKITDCTRKWFAIFRDMFTLSKKNRIACIIAGLINMMVDMRHDLGMEILRNEAFNGLMIILRSMEFVNTFGFLTVDLEYKKNKNIVVGYVELLGYHAFALSISKRKLNLSLFTREQIVKIVDNLINSNVFYSILLTVPTVIPFLLTHLTPDSIRDHRRLLILQEGNLNDKMSDNALLNLINNYLCKDLVNANKKSESNENERYLNIFRTFLECFSEDGVFFDTVCAVMEAGEDDDDPDAFFRMYPIMDEDFDEEYPLVRIVQKCPMIIPFIFDLPSQKFLSLRQTLLLNFITPALPTLLKISPFIMIPILRRCGDHKFAFLNALSQETKNLLFANLYADEIQHSEDMNLLIQYYEGCFDDKRDFLNFLREILSPEMFVKTINGNWLRSVIEDNREIATQLEKMVHGVEGGSELLTTKCRRIS